MNLDDEPADLAGYGPITAQTARRYAADESGAWRRLLTDPDSGALLDISRDSYRPVQRLRDFVLARDSVCCFPTCGQPGHRCEFEHIVAFSKGGQTCRCGGALACKPHDLCKIGTGWQYRRLPDGGYRWADDTGHGYTGYPPQRWTSARQLAGPRPRHVSSDGEVHPPACWGQQVKRHLTGRTISDVSPLPSARRASPQDSCPGALRVHQAADGGLARVRIPGGILTGPQWQALIAAASELGNGQLELTSRGNLQLRGLGAGDEAPLATRLRDAGLLPSLAHERVRNLLASPLSGRDDIGMLDIRPLIAEFDRALCARPALSELSGRFLFALDDGRADVLAAEPDIAVTAISPHSMRLLLAGQPVEAQCPAHAAVELMLAAAEAFLAERQAQGGTAWRLAELVDGPGRVAARLGTAPAAHRPGSGRHRTAPAPSPGRPIRQRDGASALVIGIPLGSLNADHARAFLGPQLILTPWRSIVLPDLDADDIPELLAACAELGMITDESDPLRDVTACTGRPGCASALADVRAEAIATHRAAIAAGEPPATGAHWSGCGRRCGRPAGTVTDLIATGSGYQLNSGDRSIEIGGTPAELAAALAALPQQAALPALAGAS
ncbi:MAG: precorrin-3B synthase [Jatrophihabitantaceae bacterium]